MGMDYRIGPAVEKAANATSRLANAFERIAAALEGEVHNSQKPTVIVIASDVFDPDIIANRIVDAMIAAESENKK